MQIKKLSIKEFGSLRDKELYLGGGINLIEGNNESGKSTVLAFIRFMLYGTPRRNAGELISEKERYINWQTGSAEGSMEITTNKGSYRIERRLSRHSAGNRESFSETCRMIDLSDGTEVYRGEVPGKVFLGIAPEVYTSTCCIRQLGCTDIEGGDVNASIENLLFSADEEIDTEKIRTKLDDFRRTLLYKNERGGKLYELESKKKLLEEKLEIAKQNSETVIAKEALAKKMKQLSEKTSHEIEEYEKQLARYEACTILKRFETLHHYETKKNLTEEALATLKAEQGYDGKLPDRPLLTQIHQEQGALSAAITTQEQAAILYQNAEQAPGGDQALAALTAVIDGEGGEARILSSVKNGRRKKKRRAAWSVVSFLMGALATATSLLMYLTEWLTPYLGSIPYLDYGLFGGGILFLSVGVITAIAAGKTAQACRSLISKLGIGDRNASIEHITAHMASCRRAKTDAEAYDRHLGDAALARDAASEALADHASRARTRLSSLSAPTSESPQELVAILSEILERFTALCSEKERIEGERATFVRLIDELSDELKDADEAALSDSIGNLPVSEVMQTMDIAKLRLSYNFTRDQHTATEQKRIALEKELIALTSVSESPARLAAKLYETEKEWAQMKAQYMAVKMAHEYLGIASDNLRKSVTPALRVRAGELMKKFTGGKYAELGISTDMAISVVADGATRSIEALSKGTKDIAYIALRLALVELICADDLPPLTFDESFTQLDDTRLASMLDILFDLGLDGKQTILFTCHKREGEMLKKLGTFHYIRLN